MLQKLISNIESFLTQIIIRYEINLINELKFQITIIITTLFTHHQIDKFQNISKLIPILLRKMDIIQQNKHFLPMYHSLTLIRFLMKHRY